jgi:hypothetical protein
MPFSPSDSVDILIRARASGQADIEALAGTAKKADDQYKALQNTLLGTNETLKALTGSIVTLNATLQEHITKVNSAGGANQRLGSSARDAAAELRFLEGSMPIRSAAQFISQLEFMGPLLKAAFPIVGAVALVEILQEIPKHIHNGILALEGWTEKSKHAFEQGIDHADKYFAHMVDLNQKMRAVQLIGLNGVDKDNAAARINILNANELRQQINDLQARLNAAQTRIDNYNNPIVSYGTPNGPAPAIAFRSTPVTAAQHEKDLITVDKLTKEIEKWRFALEELTGPKAAEINAQTAADREAEARRLSKQAIDNANRADNLLKGFIKQGETAGVNPAEKFATEFSLAVQQARELNPNVDLSLVRAEAQKQLRFKSYMVAEEYLKNQAVIDEFIHSPGDRKDFKERMENAFFAAGIDKESLRQWDLQFKDEHGVRDAERSDRRQVFKMQSRFGSAMDAASAQPENQYFNFLKEQDRKRAEAYYDYLQNLDDAKRANEGERETKKRQAELLYDRERMQIRMDGELRIGEIHKQSVEESKKVAGELFDAIRTHSTGSFIKGQFTNIERTVFSNFAGGIIHGGMTQLGKILNPLETGSNGQANWLGALLQGTPLGINQEVQSRNRNTQAIENLTSAITGAGGASGSGASTAAGVASRFTGLPISGFFGAITKLFGGGGSYNPTNADLAGLVPSMGPDAGGGTFSGNTSGTGTAAAAFRANWLGGAAALAGAGLGAYAGFSRGGTGGILTGTGSLLGGVGAALSLVDKSLGVAGPIGALAGMGLGLVSMFLGNSVEQRYKQMQNNVAGSYDRLPSSISEQFDISGYQSHIVGPGKAGVVGGVNIHINAIDTKSIIDHWSPIADAVKHAVDMNHGVNDSIRQVRR